MDPSLDAYPLRIDGPTSRMESSFTNTRSQDTRLLLIRSCDKGLFFDNGMKPFHYTDTVEVLKQTNRNMLIIAVSEKTLFV